METDERLNKQISFHTPGSVHKQAFEPIATEASNRGYDVEFVSEVPSDVDFAFYNTHHEEISSINGRCTFITFHGIDDAYKKKYYVDESWNRFDIGLVHGAAAAEVWQSCSFHPKATPKMGVYTTGWPKADRVTTDDFIQQLETHRQRLNIESGKTVLYAPTVEYDNKMERFLSVATDVCDNILVKHGPYDSDIDYTVIEQYDTDANIHILDAEFDTMIALGLPDVLVSDQSSVLFEAILVDTVPVSVIDWPISFHGQDPYFPGESIPDFAIKINEAELPKLLENMDKLSKEFVGEIKCIKEHHFHYLGTSAEKVVNLIDSIRLNDTSNLDSIPQTYSTRTYASSLPSIVYYKSRESLYQVIPERIVHQLEQSPFSSVVRTVDNLFK